MTINRAIIIILISLFVSCQNVQHLKDNKVQDKNTKIEKKIKQKKVEKVLKKEEIKEQVKEEKKVDIHTVDTDLEDNKELSMFEKINRLRVVDLLSDIKGVEVYRDKDNVTMLLSNINQETINKLSQVLLLQAGDITIYNSLSLAKELIANNISYDRIKVIKTKSPFTILKLKL